MCSAELSGLDEVLFSTRGQRATIKTRPNPARISVWRSTGFNEDRVAEICILYVPHMGSCVADRRYLVGRARAGRQAKSRTRRGYIDSLTRKATADANARPAAAEIVSFWRIFFPTGRQSLPFLKCARNLHHETWVRW